MLIMVLVGTGLVAGGLYGMSKNRTASLLNPSAKDAEMLVLKERFRTDKEWMR